LIEYISNTVTVEQHLTMLQLIAWKKHVLKSQKSSTVT